MATLAGQFFDPIHVNLFKLYDVVSNRSRFPFFGFTEMAGSFCIHNS